jgi:FixJ family two-component response regulator
MSDPGALVYVVDDDSSAREGVAALIRSAGLTPRTFASAEEFLAAPRPKTPSCLVLDVSLPGVSGLDLQQELQIESSGPRHIPDGPRRHPNDRARAQSRCGEFFDETL